MNDNTRLDYRHNVTVNILDGTFYGFAIGFASFTTILPLFVATMTGSALLIGLVPAIHNMGWLLPQLFTAKWIAKLPRLKRFVITLSLSERIPFLAFALVAGFLPVIGQKLGLILTLVLLILQGFSAGLAANGWQNLISKVIPSNRLATFFGSQAAAANLLASLGAVFAGYLLEHLPGNKGFVVCFSTASLLLSISWIFLALTREPPREITPKIQAQNSLLSNIGKILKNDPNFVWFLIARNLSQFGLMALAFYTVYAVKIHQASETAVGMFTGILLFTQMISNPILGYISDRWGRKWVMVFGSLCGAAAPFLVLISSGINLFIIVFILTGIANTIFWIVGMTLSLDFGSEEDRPIYIGIANTFIAPSSVLAPIIGGWLADISSYSVTFLFAAITGLLTTLIYIFLIHDPRRKREMNVPSY